MTQTTVVLREPSDLIASLPFILGFHPQRCVVAVHLHASRAGLIQRFDIFDEPGEWTAQERDLIHAAVEREGGTGVILVAYEDAPHESAHVLGMIRALVEELGLPLVDLLRVHDGRWRSMLCDGECCDPLGFPLPEARDTPAVAEWVGLGIDPLPSREALADLFNATDADMIPAIRPRAEIRPPKRMNSRQAAAAAAAWATLIDPAETSGPVASVPRKVVATAVGALLDVDSRDAVIAWLAPGIFPITSLDHRHWRALQAALGTTPWRWMPDADDALDADGPHEGDDLGSAARRRCGDRLLQVLRRVPADDQVPLLCVIAAFAWWQGDGVRAKLALERARDLDPSYTLAGLLHSLVSYGVRLRQLESMRASGRTVEDLTGLGA